MYLQHSLAPGISGRKHSVMPFINQPAIGAAAAIVGDAGNVGAVLAGLLFTSETISYRERLFTIAIVVTIVSFTSLALRLAFVFLRMPVRMQLMLVLNRRHESKTGTGRSYA